MSLVFYPTDEEGELGSLAERIERLMDAAQHYKAAVLENSAAHAINPMQENRPSSPRELLNAFNWQIISRLLREIRELSEVNKVDKLTKAEYLAKLAEVYEVLRAAKMSKLEAVRLALISEAAQLRSASNVA